MSTASKHPPIILASASPRRQELLVLLGLEFEVQPSDVVEYQIDGEPPDQMALRLSEQKALAGKRQGHHLIIAADTLVVVDSQVLGKPESAQQAFDMLDHLRAREHTVITGLTIINTSEGVWCQQLATTPVVMRDYSLREMEEYIATGDPMDKAGAYAIQNAMFNPVANIVGCYTNVIGLPICHLYRGLMQLGIKVPRHPLSCCTWAAQFGCSWAQAILGTRPQVDNIRHNAQAQ